MIWIIQDGRLIPLHPRDNLWRLLESSDSSYPIVLPFYTVIDWGDDSNLLSIKNNLPQTLRQGININKINKGTAQVASSNGASWDNTIVGIQPRTYIAEELPEIWNPILNDNDG